MLAIIDGVSYKAGEYYKNSVTHMILYSITRDRYAFKLRIELDSETTDTMKASTDSSCRSRKRR